MSLHRFAARRDANERDVRADLARAGWLTVQLSIADWPDLLAVKAGRKELIEVKIPGEEPDADQLRIHRMLALQGVKVYVAHSGEEFLRDVGDM